MSSMKNCSLFMIVANAVIVPFVLRYGYGVNLPIPFMMLTVGLGEVISCGVIGMIVLVALDKYKGIIFGNSEMKEKAGQA